MANGNFELWREEQPDESDSLQAIDTRRRVSTGAAAPIASARSTGWRGCGLISRRTGRAGALSKPAPDRGHNPRMRHAGAGGGPPLRRSQTPGCEAAIAQGQEGGQMTDETASAEPGSVADQGARQASPDAGSDLAGGSPHWMISVGSVGLSGPFWPSTWAITGTLGSKLHRYQVTFGLTNFCFGSFS
jgi:hypothetical protein